MLSIRIAFREKFLQLFQRFLSAFAFGVKPQYFYAPGSWESQIAAVITNIGYKQFLILRPKLDLVRWSNASSAWPQEELSPLCGNLTQALL
jgi:hypothetical protein